MLNERKGRHRPIDAVKLGPGTRKKREKIKKNPSNSKPIAWATACPEADSGPRSYRYIPLL